jgi:hypothetical protein
MTVCILQRKELKSGNKIFLFKKKSQVSIGFLVSICFAKA